MATKKRPLTKKGTPRARKGVKIKPTTLTAAELSATDPPAEVRELARQIADDGGAVLAIYREPLGGNTIVFAALPIDKVERTPFQRDVSDAHVAKLTKAMDKTKRFLDPLIVVRKDDRYYTPNGGHRLTAMTELGAKAILALVVPEVQVAYQILALNIEKAHNLRERATEVVRMYRDLADRDDLTEEKLSLELEEPALVTLGFAYEQRGRLAGAVYHPIVKKLDAFEKKPLAKSLPMREEKARILLELDDAVNEAVQKLKDKGLTSPYLKSFVVARINPIRFMKTLPPYEELLASMTKRARGMKADRVQSADLSRGGYVPDADET